MFDVCQRCGSWNPAKSIDPTGPLAICPDCGFAHPFRRLPLLILTGASGSGKTAVCSGLSTVADEIVALESDVIWGFVPADPDGGYATYRNLWLRLCKNISQSGKPVLLCGSCVPDQYPSLVERRYFSNLHFLALTMRDEVLQARLRARPNWRRSGTDAFLEDQRHFNRWFIKNGTPLPFMQVTQDEGSSTVETQVGVSSLAGTFPTIENKPSDFMLPKEPDFLTLDTSETTLDQSIMAVKMWIHVVLASEKIV